MYLISIEDFFKYQNCPNIYDLKDTAKISNILYILKNSQFQTQKQYKQPPLGKSGIVLMNFPSCNMDILPNGTKNSSNSANIVARMTWCLCWPENKINSLYFCQLIRTVAIFEVHTYSDHITSKRKI